MLKLKSTSSTHVSIELGERPNRKDYAKILNEERLTYNAAKRQHNGERVRCLVRSTCCFLFVGSLVGALVTYIYFWAVAWKDDVQPSLCTVTSVEEYNLSGLYLSEITVQTDSRSHKDASDFECLDGNSTFSLYYEYEQDIAPLNSTYECWLDTEKCELEDEGNAPLFFYGYSPFYALFFCLVATNLLRPCARAFDACIEECLRSPEPLRPLCYSNELIVEFVLSKWSRSHIPNGYEELNDDCIGLDVQTLIFLFVGDVHEDGDDVYDEDEHEDDA